MKNFKEPKRLIASFLSILILAAPLLAQQRRNLPRKPAPTPPAAAPEPAATFDSLLAADSYKVYCELRGVGGLIRSSSVNDLIDPVMKLGGPPKEFKTVVNWLNKHSDVLAGSRMLVAGWPSRPKLPTILVAVEFSSPEDAKKFYPELRDFLPTLLPTPTPTPTPAPSPLPNPIPAANSAPTLSAGPSNRRLERRVVRTELRSEKGSEPTQPPYQMQQVGSLILISDTAFTFPDLKPRGSKTLEEDQNFMLARNRFASEPLFIYVDLKSIEKEEKAQRQKWEEEAQKRAEAEAANPPKPEEVVAEMPDAELSAPPVEGETPLPEGELEPSASLQPPTVVVQSEPQTSGDAALSGGPQRGADEAGPIFFSLYAALFGGESKWPEAVGAALVFEGDAYVVRTLIINSAENKNSAIPFMPQFVSGPALVPQSPEIFPADVDLFASVSLDYPQVYEGMLKAMAQIQERERKYSGQPIKDGPLPETPFAAYEKKLGIKIKDDLLPLLGNELALALPRRAKKASNEPATKPSEDKPAADGPQPNANADPNLIIAIAVKDREAVGRLIPKLVEGFGLKGANLLAQTEKRDGTELVSYAGIFSYAFVGDFLVVSPDPAETRHVVDAYLEHQTLSSDSHFRNYTRWQPRQVLGQIYLAPGLVEAYTLGASGFGVGRNEKMNEFLAGVNPVIDPVTYSLSNDGLGPLHELHVPRNLLQLLVAGASSEVGKEPLQANEALARTALRSLAGSETAFRSDDAHYGTLDELLAENLVTKDLLENHGYRVELTSSGDRFEATAVPLEYGKTGRLSFFIDESGVLRAGDHGGGAATAADQPLD